MSNENRPLLEVPDPANPSPDPANPSPDPANPSLDSANPSPDPANPSPNPANPSPDPANPECVVNVCHLPFCILSGLYFTTLKKDTDSTAERGGGNRDRDADRETGIDAGNTASALSAGNIMITFLMLAVFIFHVVLHFIHLSLGSMVEICRIANNWSDICERFSADHNKSNCSLPREYWKFSVATTIASVGSVVSYLLITVYILIPMNNCFRNFCNSCCKRNKNKLCHQVCCLAHRKAFEQDIISPFTSSKECSFEDLCFYFHYALVLILFIGVLISAIAYLCFTYVSKSHDPSCVKNAVDIARVVLQLVGLFCAIQSCFIFSKIVYCITEQLNNLKEMYSTAELAAGSTTGRERASSMPLAADGGQATDRKRATSKATNKGQSIDDQAKALLSALKNDKQVDMECYYKLQKIDQEFIDRVKPTLDLYGVWFIFHWIFYSLTSVLDSAVIVELLLHVVSYRISATDELVPSTNAAIEAPYILYIVFFTLLHTYLFLYPCFRAAAIASARQKLISTIAKKKWCHISLAVQGNFVEYLKLQKFGFKVSVFCTEIPCDLGLAFVSLFITVCGGFLK